VKRRLRRERNEKKVRGGRKRRGDLAAKNAKGAKNEADFVDRLRSNGELTYA
jgi:hypothetical protein